MPFLGFKPRAVLLLSACSKAEPPLGRTNTCIMQCDNLPFFRPFQAQKRTTIYLSNYKVTSVIRQLLLANHFIWRGDIWLSLCLPSRLEKLEQSKPPPGQVPHGSFTSFQSVWKSQTRVEVNNELQGHKMLVGLLTTFWKRHANFGGKNPGDCWRICHHLVLAIHNVKHLSGVPPSTSHLVYRPSKMKI